MHNPIIVVCMSMIHEEDRFYFIRGLNQCAVAASYRLMIFNTITPLFETEDPNTDGEVTVFQLIPYEKLAAMVLLPHFLFNNPVLDEIVAECRKREIPVISIDKKIEGCYSFSFSYADIFEQICRHVIDVHHAKRLMMVAGTPDNSFSEERVAAFRKALTDSGLPCDDSQIGYGHFWEGPTLDVMNQWFEIEKRSFPDAIICANDSMAITVSTYLQNHGCPVPERCIVTGFDGIDQTKFHIPQMTTCQQDYHKMGSEIVAAIDLLRQGGSYPAHTSIGFHMFLSQSCGCEPVISRNINEGMHMVFERLRLANSRQEQMCNLQSDISKMTSIKDMSDVLVERFVFHSSVLAINDDIFEMPGFGAHHKGNYAFTDIVNVLCHRYLWNLQEPCSIHKTVLIPDLDRMLEQENPIIICALHYLELALGYCVFQTDISFEEYEKIYAFMSTINASFGAFHGQMQIRAINTKLKKVQNSIITGMAGVVESRDNSTGGHINRTSMVVRTFSQKLIKCADIVHLDEHFLHNVERAAPMHDIGKIAVDDVILRKQGRYTDEEYAKMKMHPAEGAKMLKIVLNEVDDDDFVRIALNVANYHHERWDGMGYPEHRAGNDIPIEARIMALADVFDALVSKRCYKEAYSFDKAFSIIRESLGTQFDPVLGGLFLECQLELTQLYTDLVWIEQNSQVKPH